MHLYRPPLAHRFRPVSHRLLGTQGVGGPSGGISATRLGRDKLPRCSALQRGSREKLLRPHWPQSQVWRARSRSYRY